MVALFTNKKGWSDGDLPSASAGSFSGNSRRSYVKVADQPPIKGEIFSTKGADAPFLAALFQERPDGHHPSGANPNLTLAEQSKTFAARRRLATKITGTGEPLPGRSGRIRTVCAPTASASHAPSIAESCTGLCARCGSRLAFGCEHHPLEKECVE